MRGHAITIACLVAAAVFYAIGFTVGFELAVVAGCVSEMVFWVRVSRGLTATEKAKTVAKECGSSTGAVHRQ